MTTSRLVRTDPPEEGSSKVIMILFGLVYVRSETGAFAGVYGTSAITTARYSQEDAV